MECKVRDLTVHYEEAGSGRPLLILHGWGLDGHATMPDFEPAFEKHTGWRRIYPDLPGHGQTPVPNWLHDHDQVLEIVLEFMDTVAPGERFVVAGVSWGGYLARGVVQRRLQQLDGVMLYVPAIHWDAVQRSRPEKPVLMHDPDFEASLQPGDAWMNSMLVLQTRAQVETIRAAWGTLGQDPAVLEALNDKPFTFDPDALPEPCPAPTLMLTGRQDNIVGYEQAWAILGNYPRGTFAVLDRAGHILDYEQTSLARALLNEWLDRVEEYIAQNAP